MMTAKTVAPRSIADLKRRAKQDAARDIITDKECDMIILQLIALEKLFNIIKEKK